MYLICWRQTPAMVMAFLKPNEDGSPPELGKDARIALQHFPGPLKYPYMHQFLTAFAGMIGCAQCAACQERGNMLLNPIHENDNIEPVACALGDILLACHSLPTERSCSFT